MAHRIFFSAMNMLLPVCGGLVGLSVSMPALIVYFLIKKSIGLGFMTFGLPTLCANLNWACELGKRNHMYRMLLLVLLPVLCMLLFVAHPVGGKAYWYASYWFIPMAVFFVQKRFQHIFFVALSSTFIAHAVGSVMWLYTGNLTAEQWLGLIPLVAVERLLFAVGATLFYSVAGRLVLTVNKIIHHKKGRCSNASANDICA